MSNTTPQAQEGAKTSKGNRPVDTLRDGSLKVAIFKNQSRNGDFYSMVSGRIYTDTNGNVRETTSLSGSEALRMSNLLSKTYDRVEALKMDDRFQERKAQLENYQTQPLEQDQPNHDHERSR